MKNKFPKLTNLSDKKYWLRQKEKVISETKRLPKTIFIRHSHNIDVLAVLSILLLASYLVVIMLKYNPEVGSNELKSKKINTDSLQRIDEWINEKETEKQRKLNIEESKLYQPKPQKDNN